MSRGVAKPGRKVRLSDDECGLCVAEHEDESLVRVRGVQRQIRRAGFQHAKQGHDETGQAFMANAHDASRSGSGVAQELREIFGLLIQRGVAQGGFAVNEGGLPRRLGSARLEQLMEQRVRLQFWRCRKCAAEFMQQTGPFLEAVEINLVNLPMWVLDESVQDAEQLIEDARLVAGCEQGMVQFSIKAETAGGSEIMQVQQQAMQTVAGVQPVELRWNPGEIRKRRGEIIEHDIEMAAASLRFGKHAAMLEAFER